jgi:hypothetical protein
MSRIRYEDMIATCDNPVLLAIALPPIEPQLFVDTTKPKVVHAVVHAPKRSGDRHKSTDARRAYKAEHERKRRATAKAQASAR